MVAVPPKTSTTMAPDITAQREAFYQELPDLSLKPLWLIYKETMSFEPQVQSVPHIWRYRDLRPQMLRAGELVSAEEAERRVLILMNPALGERPAATATLFAGLQLILSGEIARTHHHTPAAIRFILEGEGAYTAVSGEKTIMSKGDFVTTPCLTWHDHGNESDRPMIWLDGLDIPLIKSLDAMFYEEYPERQQSLVKPVDDSIKRWGSNLKPSWEKHEGLHSPLLNYRWTTSRAALAGLAEAEGSPYDGIVMEYVNPYTGGPTLPTMSAYLQLLRKGEHTRAHRHVASTVYNVAEGAGYSIVGGQRFDWEAGDTFAVPAWAWHEHASQHGEAVLFSYSDRPVLQALGLDREEALAAGHRA